MALLKFAPCHGLGFLHNFSDGDNIKRRSDSIHLPPNSRRSTVRRNSLPRRQTRCIASKWADGLFSDSNDPTDSCSVVALVPDRQFTLPIDFYQVLGAETHYLGDGIKRVYEARVRRVLHEGYSDEALTGRRQILHIACDTLANPCSRGDYNQGLIEDEIETLMREVPWNKEGGGGSLAPDLQEQIDETLEEITPCCILELLAMPLDEDHQAKREEDLRGIHE